MLCDRGVVCTHMPYFRRPGHIYIYLPNILAFICWHSTPAYYTFYYAFYYAGIFDTGLVGVQN